jgi:hypothetical protein
MPEIINNERLRFMAAEGIIVWKSTDGLDVDNNFCENKSVILENLYVDELYLSAYLPNELVAIEDIHKPATEWRPEDPYCLTDDAGAGKPSTPVLVLDSFNELNSTATFKWDASESDPLFPEVSIAGYEVESVEHFSVTPAYTNTYSTNQLNITLENLYRCSTTYTVRCRAVDTNNTFSDWSAPVDVTLGLFTPYLSIYPSVTSSKLVATLPDLNDISGRAASISADGLTAIGLNYNKHQLLLMISRTTTPWDFDDIENKPSYYSIVDKKDDEDFYPLISPDGTKVWVFSSMRGCHEYTTTTPFENFTYSKKIIFSDGEFSTAGKYMVTPTISADGSILLIGRRSSEDNLFEIYKYVLNTPWELPSDIPRDSMYTFTGLAPMPEHPEITLSDLKSFNYVNNGTVILFGFKRGSSAYTTYCEVVTPWGIDYAEMSNWDVARTENHISLFHMSPKYGLGSPECSTAILPVKEYFENTNESDNYLKAVKFI